MCPGPRALTRYWSTLQQVRHSFGVIYRDPRSSSPRSCACWRDLSSGADPETDSTTRSDMAPVHAFYGSSKGSHLHPPFYAPLAQLPNTPKWVQIHGLALEMGVFRSPRWPESAFSTLKVGSDDPISRVGTPEMTQFGV